MSQENIEILITLPFEDALLERLREISPRLRITRIPAHKTEDIPDETWNEIEILYTNRILPEPEKVPALQWIQFHWAGIDHAVETPIVKSERVITTSLSGAASSQVAEYILMMLLALGHRLPDLITNQKRAEWPRDRWDRFRPLELRGSTVGIIGYGSIGRQVAHLLQPFGATILATKKDVLHPQDTGYTPEGCGDPEGIIPRRIYPPEAIRSMVKECDFIIVTVPLTSKTRGLVNQQVLSVMKPTAYLVDISRGGVVDHQALIAALSEKKIAGAALDVFPEEPLPDSSPLWKMNNVLLTPHISGNTPFYDLRAMELFVENLRRYLDHSPLLNQVNLRKGY
jgi:phosphoglycerate dehydrogenase-like enzyme